jgi:hypothetical protein
MSNRPTYVKWTRKIGGVKVCRSCGRKHKPRARINDRPQRIKTCLGCGARLPCKLTYPKKTALTWYVREFDPRTGKTADHPCRNREAADELIHQKRRDYTPDPVQEWLIERASNLIRGVEVDNRDDAVNQLIVELGGDPRSRALKSVDWEDAIRSVCREHRDAGLSDMYVDNLASSTAQSRLKPRKTGVR